ncbi:hypothetical protein Leryth_026780 [Lithospermum erythrorhizon]|nr:hypothetical protein Leryth_026780 [Lithospermum erythrorhizon]
MVECRFSPSMGSHAQVLLPLTPLLSQPKLPPLRFSFSTRFSSRNGGDSSAGGERTKFNDFDDVGFEYRSCSNGAKQRVWWSDDDQWPWEDEKDDHGVGSFGALEGSVNFSWIFKVIRALGWMVPAIIISMLMGTGPNTIIMALVLPIGQSIVSLLLDTFWERPTNSASVRPKPKTKKRPFMRPQNNYGVGETESFHARTTNDINYQSWVDANNVSGKTEERNAKSYGGWDELDKQARTDNVPPRTPSQSADETRKQKTRRFSRRGRKSDTPLPIRLLIAVFPFLGFWTKLM